MRPVTQHMDDNEPRHTLDDPLATSTWSQPDTIAGFLRSGPNQTLMRVAAQALARSPEPGRLLDIGCGAGRNAVPLSQQGWRVFGVDLSSAMLDAARGRAGRAHWILAPMDALPFASGVFDFVVAHGIWNLARSGAEFRRGVAEAARVLRPGGALFLFTFSRATLDTAAAPVIGETFVFTQFSGAPQVFLTADEIARELGGAGFAADPDAPLRELNRRRPGELVAQQAPVIYEGLFRAAGPRPI